MEPRNGDPELRELRRGYHDRIAELREQSIGVLRCAISGIEMATRGYIEGEGSAASDMRTQARSMSRVAAEVDDEVVNLLALESPVARDLRLILAARDVTQISLLCVGLALALASRVESASRVSDPDLQSSLLQAGLSTAALLELAAAAWATLDSDTAGRVLGDAEETRQTQVNFLRNLVAQVGLPTEAAVDLGLASRAFDRLADHAIEIAERVLFAVHGRHPLVPGT